MQRPEATTFEVSELLDAARQGRFRIPDFQRPFKWKSAHVAELFDSIRKGYPVGNLLLNEEPADAGSVQFGPAVFRVPSRHDALWVVDGHQRINAIVGTLDHPSSDPHGDRHSIWIDLTDGTFHWRGHGTPVAPTWIPLRILGSYDRVTDWAISAPLAVAYPEFRKAALRFHEEITKYRVPAYVMKAADEVTLRTVFQRVNRAGLALEEREVFGAWAHRAESATGARGVGVLDSALQKLDFGDVSAPWLLQALRGVGGIDPRKDLTKHLTESEIGPLLDTTHEALVATVSFLRSDTGIPDARFLPYKMALPVLTTFFARHPRPDPRNRQLLSRWVWRGAMSGDHKNASFPRLAQLLGEITEDQTSSVQRLLAATPRAFQPLLPTEPWNPVAARSRLFLLVLWSLRPLVPHRLGFTTPAEPRAFAARRPARLVDVYMVENARQLRSLAMADETVLASHALDPTLRVALSEGDLEAVAAGRQDRLGPILERVCATRTGLNDSDRPAISRIVAPYRGAS